MQQEVPATRQVDPWRFTGGFLKNLLSAMIPAEPSYDGIPWAPVTKPVSESSVALLSTAGLSMRGDEPFDMELERTNPLRGDPGWRRLACDPNADDIHANHLHIDTGYLLGDLNVALPTARLRDLVADGSVGAIADHHYSTMGYQGNDTSTQESVSAPEIAAAMKSDSVDLALLAPV